jgi:hypothetical protein
MKQQKRKESPILGAVGAVLFATSLLATWPPTITPAQVDATKESIVLSDSAVILRAYADSLERAIITRAAALEKLAKKVSAKKAKARKSCEKPSLLVWHNNELVEAQHAEYKGYWIIDVDSICAAKDTVHISPMPSATLDTLPPQQAPKKRFWAKIISLFKSK